MSEQAKVTPKGVADSPSLSFWKMNGAQKTRHLLKVVVFLCTFGFAFPNVFEDF
jgi:hypothetical protein